MVDIRDCTWVIDTSKNVSCDMLGTIRTSSGYDLFALRADDGNIYLQTEDNIIPYDKYYFASKE